MSVLCCYAPHFLYQIASRDHAALQDRPAALLGPDDTVWAVSPLASKTGLAAGMSPRQVRARCPEVTLHPLDLDPIQATQQAWLHALRELALPLETASWGAAYLDLRPVTSDEQEVAQIAGEVGRTIRRELGTALQPAIGWDSGKFTACAAALRTAPGRMKLVAAAQEKPFLKPLPVSMLPLSPAIHQQLHWLGIHTLGAFAALPDHAVWQRFGAEGKAALQLARGKDRRPVAATMPAATETLQLSWDSPMELLPPLLADLEQQLAPRLTQLHRHFQGCLGLHCTVQFVDGSSRGVVIRLMQPTTDQEKLLLRIQQELAVMHWPDAAIGMAVSLETGELPAMQLSLFSSAEKTTQNPAKLATLLKTRHGNIFYQAELREPSHPAPERRSQRLALA